MSMREGCDEEGKTKSLVAPQTPGSKVLKLLGYAKVGDTYPEFGDTLVADIGGGLSSLAFELSSSAKEIVVVDPELGKDMHERIQEQKTYAQHRLDETNRELLDLLQDKQEVYDGIVKWEHFNPEKTPNITINDSYAQDIQGIKPESQDVVFLNFVLDKVYDGDFSLRAERDKLEAEIGKALENALLIAKVGGKIMGVHNISSHSDEIIIALDRLEYRVDYQQKGEYLVFSFIKK